MTCAAMTLVLAKGICDVRGSSGALEMSVAAGAVPRLRDASANGITQMARSESRINAPRRRCALTDWLVCFFIFILWLNVSRALCEYGREVPVLGKSAATCQDISANFFKILTTDLKLAPVPARSPLPFRSFTFYLADPISSIRERRSRSRKRLARK